MFFAPRSYKFFLMAILMGCIESSFGQTNSTIQSDSSTMPVPSYTERSKKWGPNDTIITSAIWYKNEMLSYKEHEMVWISKLSDKKLRKYIEDWTRLRNAVYVTYPYARVAGATINDISTKLTGVTSKKERKDILKSREAELRKQFQQPLENLSVYQGKILMKLINRQTNNNCYDIIKEYKGGFNARVYQTVAFFFGSNLKQDYDLAKRENRDIENIVKEIDGVWYNNPNRPLTR
jgi:benzoyl-CoA reductase/2-hydroxyglutaryl-CoA dehydratase subunit BcrC/BadD/HgdB